MSTSTAFSSDGVIGVGAGFFGLFLAHRSAQGDQLCMRSTAVSAVPETEQWP